MNKKVLELENISTYYGAICAVNQVNLFVEENEIVSLIGANGAGKTSILMTICSNPKASSGIISFNGENITNLSTHNIMRRGIAISPEGRRVFANMSVLENLQMGGFFLNKNEIEDSLKHIFSLFPKLKERENQRVGTMSGGEQQMLAIGRALMSKPKLLLLDEPTLGLAPLVINQIFEIIQNIRNEGITVFLVEQNANKSLQISDRAYVLETGRIVLQDSGKNLLNNENIKKAYLGA